MVECAVLLGAAEMDRLLLRRDFDKHVDDKNFDEHCDERYDENKNFDDW